MLNYYQELLEEAGGFHYTVRGQMHVPRKIINIISAGFFFVFEVYIISKKAAEEGVYHGTYIKW